MKTILKVLVGSRAYGLADYGSDYDYREVSILPTERILSLGFRYKGTHWDEGEIQDSTNYEIGHFLELATHCNPSILEMFVAPVEYASKEGEEMRGLLSHLVNDKRIRDAFVGYGCNQRKKMVENKDHRWPKYGVAYIRVLHQCLTWLSQRKLIVNLEGQELLFSTELLTNFLHRIKSGKSSAGEIVDTANDYIKRIDELYAWRESNEELIFPNEEAQKTIHNFLMSVRKSHWKE